MVQIKVVSLRPLIDLIMAAATALTSHEIAFLAINIAYGCLPVKKISQEFEQEKDESRF